jgi:tetratricopeptide (TPR) repeat protein
VVTAQIADLKAALERDPSSVTTRSTLARAYMLKNQVPEAEAEYGKILAVVPTFAPANFGMALIRLRQKKIDEGADYLRKVLQAEPNHVQANVMFADYQESKGNSDAAIPLLEAAHRASPSVALKMKLATVYGRTGRADEGLTRIKEVLAAQPKLPGAYVIAAQLQLQKGNIKQALEAANTATKLDPQLSVGYFTLGLIHERDREPDKALAAYRKAQALTPKDPGVLNNIAYLQASRGELTEALSLAQNASELAPNTPAILDTLGFVHYQRKDYAKAEPVLKRAVELAPKAAPMQYHLGMTYYRLGKKDDAVAALKRSLAIDEKFPDAQEARRVLKELGAS